MKKEKAAENFFYFVFVIWYLTEIIFNTTVEKIMDIPAQDINNALNKLIFILLMIEIIVLQEYSFRELVMIGCITLPICFASINSDHRVMMSFWMFLVASKYANLNKVILFAYIILCISVPLVIILCKAGALQDVTVYRGGILRHSCGFLHPNQLGIRIFQWSLCYVHVNRKRNILITYCILLVAIYFAYRIPNSKTSVISMFVFLILLIIKQFVDGNVGLNKLMKMMCIGTGLIAAMSLWLSFNYNNNNMLMKKINRWISYRFSCCKMVLKCYGVKLFGQKVSLLFQDKHYVGVVYKLYLDNAYMHLLIVYGAITFIIFVFMYMMTMKYYSNYGDYLIVSILFAFSVYGIMEMGLYSMSNNIFLLSISAFIYKNKPTRVADDSWGKVRIRLNGKRMNKCHA